MPTPGPFSLDHLEVLLTVVETGSFAAAARQLNRANSAISYAIDTLESQLGVTLFNRGSTRQPTLTREGEAILAEARSVAYGVNTFRARVRGLLEGLEAEVSLVVDEMYPSERLADVLRRFNESFPTVPLRLTRTVLDNVERLVGSGAWSIGVTGTVHISNCTLQRIELGQVRVIPVAARGHPLEQDASGGVMNHLQLVLSEHAGHDERTRGVRGAKVWRVGDLASKLALLRAGVGWCALPEPMVRKDIASGRLVHLDLPELSRGGHYPLVAIYRDDNRPGPAGRWLIEHLTINAP